MDYAETKRFEIKARLARIEVEGIPPYKQTPADGAEATRQLERREILRQRAREEFLDKPVESGRISLDITYYRHTGRSDAANIVGGIADSLEGILYVNDRMIGEIFYIEEPGKQDSYEISVSII